MLDMLADLMLCAITQRKVPLLRVGALSLSSWLSIYTVCIQQVLKMQRPVEALALTA